MADDAIEIDFQLTPEDCAKFSADLSQPFFLKPSKFRLATMMGAITFFGLLFFWLFMYVFALAMGTRTLDDIGAELHNFTSFEFLASYGIMLVCFVAILENMYEDKNAYKHSSSHALRMIKSGANKAILAPMHAALSKENIKVRSDFTAYTFQWNGVEKVAILNGDFCIFYSSMSALCIPARFFKSEEEKQAIFNTCNTWFSDANKAE